MKFIKVSISMYITDENLGDLAGADINLKLKKIVTFAQEEMKATEIEHNWLERECDPLGYKTDTGE